MTDAFANASNNLLDDIIGALDDMKPDGETLLREKYSRIHPAAASAMARGASTRQILEALKSKGLELHHAKLGKLFRAETEARNERGERICCVMCAQPLKFKTHDRVDEIVSEADGVHNRGEGDA
jgi:hypothetical protein